MPFSRPTLTDLRAAAAADVDAALPGAQTVLRYSNLNVLAQTVAGGVHGLYGYLDWIAQQSTPFSATAPEYVEAWGGLKGVVRKAATSAGGAVGFTGAPASLIEALTRLVRADGVVYQLDADVTLGGGGTASGTVTAVEAGISGNSPAGTTLVLSSPISGVGSTATCPDGLTGGVDVEDTAALKTRMLQAYAGRGRGGAPDDYETWALEVPGVTRAWPQRNGIGPGTVVVLFMMDLVNIADDGFPQGTDGVAADETRGTPATGDQLTVADYIFGPGRRPVTALVYVAAPSPNTVTFTIAGVASVPTRALIDAAIDTVFIDQGEPGGLVEMSHLESAISAIPAAVGYVITAVVCSDGAVSPGATGNITSNAGFLPVRGATTWS
jgi:uncharacterized phage protein gp47/JayE